MEKLEKKGLNIATLGNGSKTYMPYAIYIETQVGKRCWRNYTVNIIRGILYNDYGLTLNTDESSTFHIEIEAINALKKAIKNHEASIKRFEDLNIISFTDKEIT